MPSPTYREFERSLKAGDLGKASHYLSALSMTEMLPALAACNTGRQKVVEAARQEFMARTPPWRASFERIRWAAEVVGKKALPGWRPAGLPKDQVEAAKSFLAPANPASGGLTVFWSRAKVGPWPSDAKKWTRAEEREIYTGSLKWIGALAQSINRESLSKGTWRENLVIPFENGGKKYYARHAWHDLQGATMRTGRFPATEIRPT